MTRTTGQRRAVAVGGGSGLPATIHALLELGYKTSAVVAMADNGGSTGKLRENVGIIPPGDIRNCLVAMAADPSDPMTKAIQYRFPPFADEERGHALGNLMIAALTQTTGSFPQSVEVIGKMIDARGHVYPSTLEDVQLRGIDREGTIREGQVALSRSGAAIERAWLDPEGAAGYDKALDAISQADLVVLGPGSLYTSVIPNILVGGFVEALAESGAEVVFVCNVSNQQGETHNLSAADHVQALKDHGLGDLLDAVIVHDHRDAGSLSQIVQPVVLDAAERAEIEDGGVAVILADVVDPLRPSWHDCTKLSKAIAEAVGICRSPQK